MFFFGGGCSVPLFVEVGAVVLLVVSRPCSGVCVYVFSFKYIYIYGERPFEMMFPFR